MRRAVLSVVVLLALGGCGGSPSAAAPATVTVTSSSTTSPLASSGFPNDQLTNATVEKLFGDALQQHGFVPRFGTVRDGIDVAREVCNRLAAGDSYATVSAMLTKNGMTPEEAGAFASMATVAFCPRDASKING